jgi:hypothetical protein
MKSKILWEAKQSQKNKSNLFRYENFLSSKYKFIPTQNYNKLHKWSVDNPKKCWNSIWDFSKVKG